MMRERERPRWPASGNAPCMPTITYTWADWRRIIATLRDADIPYMRGHAALIEEQLEAHAPGEALVGLALSEDVYLRSVNWARWKLGLPLPTSDDR
jgi:hypothetical protein